MAVKYKSSDIRKRIKLARDANDKVAWDNVDRAAGANSSKRPAWVGVIDESGFPVIPFGQTVRNTSWETGVSAKKSKKKGGK